jgi:hypothetical protein
VRYGLEATSISIKYLQKSQQTIPRIIIPKLGYNRHTPTPIVYASTHFGGIGLIDLSTAQGLAHVVYIIGHIRARSDVANSIHILLESYLLLAGMVESPLIDLPNITYLNAPWLEITRSFLRQNNLTISIPSLACPKLIRSNEKSIMALALKHTSNNANLRL